ncbi:MAG: agmatinase [Candidatus Bathyarchaeota archaeon]|nr:agmatinase [Candidatus Bathyarchaeota archaeon]
MPTNPTFQPFLDKGIDPEGMDYVLFSAPLDKTGSNRSGTRFGPNAIRQESTYLDTLSARTGLDWGDIHLADIGDMECPDVETALKEIEETIESMDSFPVMLGGEHTITLGALRALKPDLVVVYDAHLDLRNELFGEKLCHATYLRRGFEELGFKAIVIGARALSAEETEYADSYEDLCYVTAQQVIKEDWSTSTLSKLLKKSKRTYLSIDMDVLDPSYAPAVGNLHPEGLSTAQLMDLVSLSVNEKLVGFDLNEVYPHYDTGVTAITAAYIVMETLYSHITSKK